MLYTTPMLLVNFPEKNGAGWQLIPEGGDIVPDRLEGREDVHVPHPAGPEVLGRLARHGGCVSAGVGAEPEPEDGLAGRRQHPAAEGRRRRRAFLDGKTQHISGISAKGLTLTFHLTKPNPTFVGDPVDAVVRRCQAEHAVHDHRA